VTEIATFGQAVGDLPEAGRQRLVEAVNRIYRQAGQRKGSTVGAVGETLVSRAGFEPVRTSEEPTETEATAQEALQALLKADVLRPVAEGLVAKVAPEAIVAIVEAVRSDGQVRNPAAVIVARLKAWQAGDPLPAKARSPLPIGCYYDETGAARTASGARLDR
jgi:hypothetical protein